MLPGDRAVRLPPAAMTGGQARYREASCPAHTCTRVHTAHSFCASTVYVFPQTHGPKQSTYMHLYKSHGALQTMVTL